MLHIMFDSEISFPLSMLHLATLSDTICHMTIWEKDQQELSTDASQYSKYVIDCLSIETLPEQQETFQIDCSE